MEQPGSPWRSRRCIEPATRRTSWRHSLPARTLPSGFLLDGMAGKQQFQEFIIHIREIPADHFQRRAKLVGSDYQGFIDFAKRFVHVNLHLLLPAGVVFRVAMLVFESLDGSARV